MPIPIQLFRAGLVRACHSKEIEERYARFEAEHEAAGIPIQPHEFAAGRVLSQAEIARLERRRQFFGNEYSG